MVMWAPPCSHVGSTLRGHVGSTSWSCGFNFMWAVGCGNVGPTSWSCGFYIVMWAVGCSNVGSVSWALSHGHMGCSS